MRVVTRLGVPLAATILLLLPALWNGFPLLQYDTGGYIARWYEGTLEESRSTVYGLFLDLLARPDFWPALVVQSALTVWVLALALRIYGFGAKILLITVAALTLLTGLPWLASVLLTDIFSALAVLALHLLLIHADALRRWERFALVVFIAFAAATHGGTLVVLLALLGVGVLVALWDRTLLPWRRLANGAAALMLSAAMLLTANYAVVRRIAWTPGGIGLAFGRMLQDGIVARFLDEHCPDPRFKLCDHRQELPTDADVFFWGESVFDRLGRFQGLNDEMETIVRESLRDYPWLELETAIAATARQVVLVRTGYGVNTEIWHTYGMIENFLPAMQPAMRAARQQKGELAAVFPAINDVHVPAAYASMLLLLAVMALAVRRRRYRDLGLLATTATLAILANAVVFGALSGPHDRYGARIVWLATFVVLLVPWRAALSNPRAGCHRPIIA